MSPQSGTESGMSLSLGSSNKSQNIKFCDQRDDYTYTIDSTMDPTRMGQDSDDADLGNFFQRPLKLQSYEWGTGLLLSESFNPWQLYFENPRVANRIANFELLRCKLHVKFVINGNGFQYGRAMASYHPLDLFDSLTNHSTLIPQTAVQESQMPHIFLDPTLSRGGEMILPFFFYKNNMSIPQSDWQEMGKIFVRDLNMLKHANGASDKATISIFVWAEDVTLGVLTSRESATLTPQSGMESEVDKANRSGMISGPATTVATVATALAAVPAIKPFALATATVATGVATAAKLLGYSRPPMTVTPAPFRNTACASLACTTLPDTVDKLSIDDKQELTIDPRIAGLGADDPLIIADIAKRESYLTSFTWTIGTAPETLLWNARIDPVTWAYSSGAQSFHFPACCMAALPFRYWTGSMKFRFQFVVSAFHKGRVKIVYDPNWLATNEYNVNYLEIVDIADKSDFTISIANGQATTLLEHHDPGIESVTQMYGTTAFTSKEAGNGVIGVYVVNELTTPNSIANNDIQVNVFVSMGDDFEVFVPDQKFGRFVFKAPAGARTLEAQSGLEVADAENTDEKDAPVQSMTSTLGDRYDNFSNLNFVYTGETIKSFRPLLKRYNLHTTICSQDSLHNTHWMLTPMFPYLRGYVSGALHTTGAGLPYTYCNTVLLHWVTYAFSSWRGAIRRKVIVRGNRNTGVPVTMLAHRTRAAGYNYVKSLTMTATTNIIGAHAVVSSAATPIQYLQPNLGATGMTYRNGNVNETLEVESPYYSKYRFSPGKTQDWTSSSTARLDTDGIIIQIDAVGSPTTFFPIYVAAGEDFQVYFFTGLPPMYFENEPPFY